MGRRSDIDWDAIEREFRASRLTIREIGRQHGVAASAISRRATKERWPRDLAVEVRQRTRAALIASGATIVHDQATEKATPEPKKSNTDSRARDNAAIEVAVRTRVTVVRQHQSLLGRAVRLAECLLTQLEEADQSVREIAQEIVDETRNDRTSAERPTTARRQKMLRAVAF